MVRTLMALGGGTPELSTTHVAEVFPPPRVTKMARRCGLSPGIAVDLRTGWDLNDPQDVKKLWAYLEQERPLLIVGSPERRPFRNFVEP